MVAITNDETKSNNNNNNNNNSNNNNFKRGSIMISDYDADSSFSVNSKEKESVNSDIMVKQKGIEEKIFTLKIENKSFGLGIEILDDTNFIHFSIPLLKASLSQLYLLLEMEGTSLNVEVEITASVSSYNDIIQVWEPFVEPFRISLQTQVDDNSLNVLVCMQPKHIINFNITTSFLGRVVKAHTYLTKMGLFDNTMQQTSFFESEASSKRQTYPVMIKNMTGKSIDYTIPVPGKSQILCLAPGDEREFDVTEGVYINTEKLTLIS
jgi:hypothetical protein